MNDFFKPGIQPEIFKMAFTQIRVLPIVEQVDQPRPKIMSILVVMMVLMVLMAGLLGDFRQMAVQCSIVEKNNCYQEKQEKTYVGLCRHPAKVKNIMEFFCSLNLSCLLHLTSATSHPPVQYIPFRQAQTRCDRHTRPKERVCHCECRPSPHYRGRRRLFAPSG